jgi:hypothetical protein
MTTKLWDIYIKITEDTFLLYMDIPMVLEDEWKIQNLLPDGLKYKGWNYSYGYCTCLVDPRYDYVELRNTFVDNINKAGLLTNLTKI